MRARVGIWSTEHRIPNSNLPTPTVFGWMVPFGFLVGVSYMNLSTMLALVLLPRPLRCCNYWHVLPAPSLILLRQPLCSQNRRSFWVGGCIWLKEPWSWFYLASLVQWLNLSIVEVDQMNESLSAQFVDRNYQWHFGDGEGRGSISLVFLEHKLLCPLLVSWVTQTWYLLTGTWAGTGGNLSQGAMWKLVTWGISPPGQQQHALWTPLSLEQRDALASVSHLVCSAVGDRPAEVTHI